jgi:hypothetical protein
MGGGLPNARERRPDPDPIPTRSRPDPDPTERPSDTVDRAHKANHRSRRVTAWGRRKPEKNAGGCDTEC